MSTNSVLEITSTVEFRNRLKLGSSTNEVLAALGTPASIVQDAAGEFWTYPARPFPADDNMRGTWVIGATADFTNARLAAVSFVYSGPRSEDRKTEIVEAQLAQLQFYVVGDKPVEGGRFIDTSNLPKLGHIKPTPDLVVSGLKRVTVTEQLETDSENNQRTNWGFRFDLSDEAIPALKAMTTTNLFKKILITVNDEPFFAPKIVVPIEAGSFELRLDDRSSMENLKRRMTQMSQPKR